MPDMREWKKAPEAAVAFFETIAPAGPGIERRKMFGYPTLFANGNMFMGMFADRLFLRLSESDRGEFMRLDGAAPLEPAPGHVMKEYATVPAWLLDDMDRLNGWIGRSLDYALDMPPKEPKPRRKKSGGRITG